MKVAHSCRAWIALGALLLTVRLDLTEAGAQTLDKIRMGYSGTGINNYVVELGKRLGIFRRNNLELEVVYVTAARCSTRR